MSIPTSQRVTSSLKGAAFQTVRARDSRGLAYRVRQEIMTLQRLREDPLPPMRTELPRGRIRTSRDIITAAGRTGRR